MPPVVASKDAHLPSAESYFRRFVDPQTEAMARITAMRKLVEAGVVHTLEGLLPLTLRLKGKPYTLKNHYPFAPLFRLRRAKKTVVVAGRQVSKSTCIASSSIVLANAVPNVTGLCLTPLFEQIRRFSGNYVRPFIDTSPVKQLWSNTTTENSVLQRSFVNNSKLIFTFALLDADRTRGITADWITYDEVQDMDPDHFSVVGEVISHSDYGWEMYTGTAKTTDGPLAGLFQKSSQAEWFIKCTHCGEWNIPSLEFHAEKMVGPYHDFISEEQPGTVCHKCQQPVNPRQGRWVHRYPERRWSFAGYHVPQIIMPLHFAKPDKWGELLIKRESYAPNRFWNECMGESYDTGAKLLSLEELKAAAVLPWKNNREPGPEVLRRLPHYERLIVGIDWGGGGEKSVSFTVICLLGVASSGRIDCLWGRRLLNPNDHLAEAKEISRYIHMFKPHVIAHDYTGAGGLRDTFLAQAGVPLDRMMPISYVRSGANSLVRYIPASPAHQRDHYRVDKTRTLLYTLNAIKLGWLRFFQYDYDGVESVGLLHDFLALVQEKLESHNVGDIYIIKRQHDAPDDFAQAVNVACTAAWHSTQSWPNFAHLDQYRLTAEQARVVNGEGADWEG